MSDWEEVALADVCQSVVDGDWIESKDQGGDDYRLLQVSNIGLGSFRETGKFRYVTSDTFRRLRCTEVRPGMVLVARMPDPVGRAWYVNELASPVITSVDVAIIDPDPGRLDGRFCAYALNSPARLAEWAAFAGGTTRMRITRRQLADARLRLPPLTTQRQIAAILGSIDDLIENNRRRAEVLEEMARAIYQEWFLRFRYPGHEDVPTVDSPLGPIPDGWSVRRLGDISVNFDRRRRPLSKMQRQERRGSIPYYGAAKLIDWIDGWIFDGEYLLFAEDGSVQTQDGYPMLQLVEGKFWANNHTHILQGSGVSTRFLYLASAVQPISGFVTGAAQPKITQANLNRIQLIVATPDVQRSFDDLINPVFDEWRQVQAANGPLSALRDVLLPRLVTGQIDVSLVGPEEAASA